MVRGGLAFGRKEKTMRFGIYLAAVLQGVAASACCWGEGRQYRSDAASATCKQERGGGAAILENIYGYQI